MRLVSTLHDEIVHSRRVKVLCQHVARLLPADATVLDVGCGDGLLSSLIAAARPDCSIEGIDVLVRGDTHICVSHFDGSSVPFGDQAIDVVLMVDVLHHTVDPMVLLREATRVARKAVIIKDHTRNGLMAYSTLRFMDWVGNAHHGVALPYNYWPERQWRRAFGELGLAVDRWERRLGLYGAPADWIFGRSLHFVAKLVARTEA